MAEQNHPTHNTSHRNDDGPDVLRHALGIQGVEVIPTNGRYNLAVDVGSQDVTQLEEGAPSARFLIVEEDKEAGIEVSDTLDAGGVMLLEREHEDEERIFYRVPLGAKPLSHERFFPGRRSTETYVSDEELCEGLGRLWRNIYGAVGQLPTDMPLRHTGMLEFSGAETTLFPIPPYRWEGFDRVENAREHFLASMLEELLLPSTASGDYERLVSAADRAWQERQG